MLIISDCGATKADWALIRNGKVECRFTTRGFNAAVEKSVDFLVRDLVWNLGEWASARDEELEIWFYCAGVVAGNLTAGIRNSFRKFFSRAKVEVCSDMLGAARAVCGHSAGVVGILGTGSNSCLYDGEGISVQGKGGGYVLGDEASGAWFGKRLLSDYIRRLLPQDLDDALGENYGIDYQKIVRGVYCSGAPSAYLASFFPFIQSHLDSPYVRKLLKEGLDAYFQRVLSAYSAELETMPLSFCGSVACICEADIRKCAEEKGWKICRFLRSPIEGLIEYHTGYGV